MKHLGDICRINGAEAEPVDVIIGGSPCQDLSVAGKRAGLDGKRSGLFMEQIRIIKEMREADGRTTGRSAQLVRPRFMVWENVPGAFSSNGIEDFRAVLEETARIAQPDADIPRPPKKWTTAGCIMGDGWSIAWRVLDAQFWGVPQRRRRIALVADFGGQSAPEILFVEQGVSWHPAESGAERQGTSTDAERGVRAAGFKWGQGAQARSIGYSEELSPTLPSDAGGNTAPAVFCIQGDIARGAHEGQNGIGVQEDVCYTLNTIDRPAVAYSFDSLASNSMKSKNPHSGCREVEIAKTLDTTDPNPSKNQGGICIVESVTFSGENATSKYNVQNPQPGDPCHTLDQDSRNYLVQPAVCIGNGQAHIADHLTVDVCQTLNCMHDQMAVMVAAVDCRNFSETGETFGTLQAKENGGQSLNYMGAVRQDQSVRRLTPLECSRLQGYPDNWAHIPSLPQTEENVEFFTRVWAEWNAMNGLKPKTRSAVINWLKNPSSDSAEYKAYGNSIARPPWKFILSRIYAQGARTMASLFDGIGGFPLIWNELGGETKWASEIEPFPIAVTKYHFGEEKRWQN